MLMRSLALLASAVLVTQACGAHRAFTGSFEGTGRACSGTLTVEARSLSWLTPFSKCRKVPYETIDQSVSGHQQQYAFQLKQHAHDCLYTVLYLAHQNDANMDIHWNVIGYATMRDYEADKQQGYKAASPSDLSCYLVTR
ncbi:MAG TPA: hypothetical protein VMA34_13190 [Terracidiphilus sp.]|nr:hypothetical protein [Terracidiphilus sp.]